MKINTNIYSDLVFEIIKLKDKDDNEDVDEDEDENEDEDEDENENEDCWEYWRVSITAGCKRLLLLTVRR